MASNARPLPPGDINPWAKTIEQDVDQLLQDTSRLSTNTLAALQASGVAVQAATLAASGSALVRGSYVSDLAVGAGWLTSISLPINPITSLTGRIELNLSAAVRNGSARVCYSITDVNGVVLVNRDTIRDTFTRCLALTGGATFPASATHVEILDVGTNPIIVKAEVYGEAAGVILSGISLTVRPTP